MRRPARVADRCVDEAERIVAVNAAVHERAHIPFKDCGRDGAVLHVGKLPFATGGDNGHAMHALRKTLGKLLTEGGASTRQVMRTLGHDDIEHAELYSRKAEQVLMATERMDQVVKPMDRRKARG